MYKRRVKDKKKKIEPLKEERDYLGKSSQAAVSTRRVFFVNEKYERLIVTGHDVREGGEPSRYLGILDDIPKRGEHITSADHKIKYLVLRVERVLNNSKVVPPQIFVVLRKEE
jgi:hypothetical protein